MLHRCAHHMVANGNSPGSGLWAGTLLSALSTVLWIALFIGLAWALLRWVFPYIRPIMTGIIADIFGMEPVDTPPLEILRQRYAAGEIDAVTFEQMRERLEASYHHGEPRHPS